MPKRSHGALRVLYTSCQSRPTSFADGPGYLYAFCDNGHKWKIGMTQNFVRRKRQWDRQCPCAGRKWMVPIAVTRRRRAEALAHLLLESQCHDRPRICCRHSHELSSTRSQNSSRDFYIQHEPEIYMEEDRSAVASRGREGVSEMDSNNNFLTARTQTNNTRSVKAHELSTIVFVHLSSYCKTNLVKNKTRSSNTMIHGTVVDKYEEKQSEQAIMLSEPTITRLEQAIIQGGTGVLKLGPAVSQCSQA
ncbi:hypothetical protein F5880DRAFT_1512410 [Lentinula raphanica]|nr:hypothetical protein F5880DRAFT_1512410 [Lentinula raphanica]